MADLTGDMPSLQWAGLVQQTKVFEIANGVQLYIGSLVKLASGYATKMTTTALLVGVAVCGGVPGSNPVMDGFNLLSQPIPAIAVGDTSADEGNVPTVVVETGQFTWQRVTLTLANGTLNGDITDVGTKVYTGNSDNIADATDTQSGTDHPLGNITKFYSADATTAVYDILVNSYDARTRGN